MTSINDFTENCKTDVYALIPPVQIFAISRMVACISHDLRQPLTAILANAEFLARPDLSEMERIELFRENQLGCRPDRCATFLTAEGFQGQ
jgi:signal transduction histidine kinase